MVFSPDGKKLLISHWDDKGGVAVVDLTSMEPKPTLAFASDEDGDFEIFAGRTNGKDFTQLTVNRATDRFPRWSHDGGMLAYVTDEQGGNLICVYNLFSGARRLLAKTAIEYRPGFGPPLDWSPTRHEIAFVPDKKSISIVGASSGDVRMVLLENEFPQTEITCICWQDQNRILFAAQTPASTFSHALFSLQLDTGEVKKLLDSRTSGGYFFAPVPSPNGEKILLARRDPADEVTDLVIADGRFDRTDLQNLPGKGVMPGMTWMPDGNTIIFSAKAGATYQLFWHLLWEKTNRQITTFDGDCFDSHVMRSRWQPADDGSQGDR